MWRDNVYLIEYQLELNLALNKICHIPILQIYIKKL